MRDVVESRTLSAAFVHVPLGKVHLEYTIPLRGAVGRYTFSATSAQVSSDRMC